MRRALVLAFVVLLASPAAWAGNPARGLARQQLEFGVAVARAGLWREAIYRWQKAVEIDPTYAAAYNDLAIAYEHDGQLEKAKIAYEKAAELDPKNVHIKQNFDFFKEINERIQAKTPR